MSAADEIRKAAETLRAAAEAATEGPWRFEAEGDYECGEPRCCHEYWDNRIWGGGVVLAESHMLSDADGKYITMLDSTVGLLVADWLDAEVDAADQIQETTGLFHHGDDGTTTEREVEWASPNALVVARAINGSAS